MATTSTDFLDLIYKSGLVRPEQVQEVFHSGIPETPNLISDGLIRAGLLTVYQSKQLVMGKTKGFFLGPYKILQPLGSGGMGMVFLAIHTSLDRKVAIKVLTADKANDKLTFERFQREARAAAALDHPNIVRMHDISQASAVHFLVMEYVDGNDLQSLMSQTGPLHYAQAAQYIAHAAAGLRHAHEKGFIHRDIKPANLMLAKDGTVKILDMGLARSFSDSKDSLTDNLADGEITGTVDFLSPEQAMNHPLDERSDIYSLGATFYALLTGHPPFSGTTAQKLMQHQSKDPASLFRKLSERIPQALIDVIIKMMAKKPSDRFQTAEDVVDALGPWLPSISTRTIVPHLSTIVELTNQTGPGKSTARLSRKANAGLHGQLPNSQIRWGRKQKQMLVCAAIGIALLIGGIIYFLTPSDLTEPIKITREGSENFVSKQTGSPSSTSSSGKKINEASSQTNKKGSNNSVIYRFDPSTYPEFRTTKRGFQPSNAPLEHTDTSSFSNWDQETLTEFSRETKDGKPVFGIGHREGKPSGQLVCPSETVTKTPQISGKEYILRIEYMAQGKGKWWLAIQHLHEQNKPLIGKVVETTNGEWKVYEARFTYPNVGYTRAVVQTSPGPNDGMLYIRSLEIIDASHNVSTRN